MSSLRPQFAETVTRIARDDKSLFVIVGDISHGLLSSFREENPERYRNIGICEPAMVSLSAGLNEMGYTPVIHTIAPFLIERSFEQIKLDFGYQNLSCNLVSVGSSFDYSKLGCSHHSYIDAALISSIPNSSVFLPASPGEFDILFQKNYGEPGVKYFRLTENGHDLDIDRKLLSKQKGILLQEGSQVSVVALGPSLSSALKLYGKLKELGISVELIYINILKPFDYRIVRDSVSKTHNLITISEISSVGGLHAQCLKAISGDFVFRSLDFSVDSFIGGYGDHEDLLIKAGLDAEGIMRTLMETNFFQFL